MSLLVNCHPPFVVPSEHGKARRNSNIERVPADVAFGEDFADVNDDQNGKDSNFKRNSKQRVTWSVGTRSTNVCSNHPTHQHFTTT